MRSTIILSCARYAASLLSIATILAWAHHGVADPAMPSDSAPTEAMPPSGTMQPDAEHAASIAQPALDKTTPKAPAMLPSGEASKATTPSEGLAITPPAESAPTPPPTQSAPTPSSTESSAATPATDSSATAPSTDTPTAPSTPSLEENSGATQPSL